MLLTDTNTGGSQHARGAMSTPQQLSRSTEQAAVCWLKSHKGMRPLSPFSLEGCDTDTIVTNAILTASYHPTMTFSGLPIQPVHTGLFHRLPLSSGIARRRATAASN